MPYDLTVNGRHQSVDADPSTPLLWVLRYHLGMTGTKWLRHRPVRRLHCPYRRHPDTVVSGASRKRGRGQRHDDRGLSQDSSHPLQQPWVEMNVPQCGYCQSGMLMAAAGLLKNIPNPTDTDIDTNVDNICRCGTYPRVRAAIHKAAARSKA